MLEILILGDMGIVGYMRSRSLEFEFSVDFNFDLHGRVEGKE